MAFDLIIPQALLTHAFVAVHESGTGPSRTCHSRRRMSAADMPRLHGLVSKRRDRPYQGGRSKHWVTVKNRQHPAMNRAMEALG
jgi:ATP-dependent DNA ligase